MFRYVSGGAILTLAAMGAGLVQEQEPIIAGTRKFETVSVKASASTSKFPRVQTTPGRYTARGISTKGLIADAYHLEAYQIVDGPRWVESDLYDVDGVGQGPAKRDDWRLMLQAMLADRFGLKVRREMRELAVYALGVGKGGVKFRERQGAEESFDPRSRASSMVHFRNLSEVAVFLSRYAAGRPVVDKTGLTGNYELNVDLAKYMQPEESRGPSDTVFLEAVLSQLGLKMTGARSTVEMLVLERVEKPSAN